jgi:hypothetical protein
MVGTVSTTGTGDPSLENKVISAVTDTSISVLNTAINYSIYSPFFPPYFPPYFPPSFCSCGACTWGGLYSCEGTLSYEYYTCGCAGCPGEGGYNQAYRNGICGYVDPCAGYGCGGPADCFKYTFTDVSVNSVNCGDNGDGTGTACYWAWGDCNCNCPATTVYQLYCGAC